jgi:hypothetical protein
MSKKVWRGYQDGCAIKTAYDNAPYTSWLNCTVVPDKALFPVKEARAVVKAAEAWADSDISDSVPKLEFNLAMSLVKFHKAQRAMKTKMKGT